MTTQPPNYIEEQKKIIDNNVVSSSLNKDHPQSQQQPAFNYITRKPMSPFLYNPNICISSNIKLEKYKNRFIFIFFLLLPDDQLETSDNTKLTLDGIYKNLPSLQTWGITHKNILICAFLQTTQDPQTKKDIQNNDDFLITPYKTSSQFKDPIEIWFIKKRKQIFEVEALKCFYEGIIKDILGDSFVYIAVTKSGIIPLGTCLSDLIVTMHDSVKDNRNWIAVPAIQLNTSNMFGKVQAFEQTWFNVFDLSNYDMSGTIPINTNLTVIRLSPSWFNDIIMFYRDMNATMGLSYHDYAQSLFLRRTNYHIQYISDIECVANIKNTNYINYMTTFVEKNSGYYGNFVNLLRIVLSGKLSITAKLVSIQILIGMCFEFILPALFTMVLYTILCEAFNTTVDNRPALFFTWLYVILIAWNTCISLTWKTGLVLSNYIMYFLMELFYWFALVCSLIAMDVVKKNKNGNEYKFDIPAIVLIITFNVIAGLVPICLSFKKFMDNIIGGLLYVGLGASCSTSTFLTSYIVNSTMFSYGKHGKDIKGVLLVIFILLNSAFGFWTLFCTSRKRRVNAVLALAIIFTIYNVIKMIIISIRIFSRVKNRGNDGNKVKQLKIEIEDMKKQMTLNENNHEGYGTSNIRDQSGWNEGSEKEYNYEEVGGMQNNHNRYDSGNIVNKDAIEIEIDDDYNNEDKKKNESFENDGYGNKKDNNISGNDDDYQRTSSKNEPL